MGKTKMRITRWIQVGIVVLATVVMGQAQNAKLTADEQNTIAIFRQASRGVVYITARTTIASPFEKHAMDATNSSTGTGFVIDQEGRVLTAFHIIKDRDQITVALGTRQLPARLIGTAPQLDIALLQINVPKDDIFPVPLGTSRD